MVALSFQEYWWVAAKMPRGDAHHHGQQHAEHRHDERVLKPLEHLVRNGALVHVGSAKVALDGVFQEPKITGKKGVVKPQFFPQLLNLLFRGLIAQNNAGRVARRDVDEEKDDQGNTHQDWNHKQQPFDDIPDHSNHSIFLKSALRL